MYSFLKFSYGTIHIICLSFGKLYFLWIWLFLLVFKCIVTKLFTVFLYVIKFSNSYSYILFSLIILLIYTLCLLFFISHAGHFFFFLNNQLHFPGLIYACIFSFHFLEFFLFFFSFLCFFKNPLYHPFNILVWIISSLTFIPLLQHKHLSLYVSP